MSGRTTLPAISARDCGENPLMVRRPLPRSADLQSAVSQTCSLPGSPTERVVESTEPIDHPRPLLLKSKQRAARCESRQFRSPSALERLADCKSAIQQTASLRYAAEASLNRDLIGESL